MATDEGVPALQGRALSYRDDEGALWVGGWGSDGGPDLYPAEGAHVRVLSACDGVRGSAELARDVGMSIEDVTRVLTEWRARIPRSLLWRSSDERIRKQRAIARDMLNEARAVEGLASIPDNRAYHLAGIADAEHQFEHVEATVSHAYSVVHPGLRGRTYGEAFFDRCSSLGAIGAGRRILEIGCGTGRFACAFLDRFSRCRPDDYRTASYTMFDLAPRLAASQRALTAAHADRIDVEHGDIEDHAFSKPFDLVIANEMIADLSVELVDRDSPLDAPTAKKYGISGERGLRRFLVNAGAIRLLEQVAAVLRPGGHAIVTEYGSRAAFPVAVKLGDHVEHSIHFGHLEQAARALGLSPTCEPLDAFLGFDTTCEVISVNSLTLLRQLSPRLFGRELPMVAYTREQLRATLGDALDRVQGLWFVPIGDRASVLCPGEFQALRLSRTAQAT